MPEATPELLPLRVFKQVLPESPLEGHVWEGSTSPGASRLSLDVLAASHTHPMQVCPQKAGTQGPRA